MAWDPPGLGERVILPPPLSRDPVMGLCSPGPALLQPGLPAVGYDLARGWLRLARRPHPESNEGELATCYAHHIGQEEDAVRGLGPAPPRPVHSGSFWWGKRQAGFQGSPSLLAQSRRANPGDCQPVSLPFFDLQPMNVGVWPISGHLELKKHPCREAARGIGYLWEFEVTWALREAILASCSIPGSSKDRPGSLQSEGREPQPRDPRPQPLVGSLPALLLALFLPLPLLRAGVPAHLQDVALGPPLLGLGQGCSGLCGCPGPAAQPAAQSPWCW